MERRSGPSGRRPLRVYMKPVKWGATGFAGSSGCRGGRRSCLQLRHHRRTGCSSMPYSAVGNCPTCNPTRLAVPDVGIGLRESRSEARAACSATDAARTGIAVSDRDRHSSCQGAAGEPPMRTFVRPVMLHPETIACACTCCCCPDRRTGDGSCHPLAG